MDIGKVCNVIDKDYGANIFCKRWITAIDKNKIRYETYKLVDGNHYFKIYVLFY